MERIARTHTDKGKKVSGGMVETRSQKSSERQKAMLEVEIHPDPAMDENREGHGPEGRGNRRLASESTPVEQGQDFATSIRTIRIYPTSLLKKWRLQDHPQTKL